MNADLRTDVLDANRCFYEAFRNGDIEWMDQIWARHETVSVYHPGWSGIVGRADVMASWRQVMVHSVPPDIYPSDVYVLLSGKRKATVFCTENVGEAAIFASNIFVCEDEEWRLIHHQATPLPIQVG